MEITELLEFVEKNGASDLHLSSTNPPVMRVSGEMMPLQVANQSSDDVTSLLHSIMTEKQRAQYEAELEIDFAVQFGSTSRFRVNAYNTANGPAAVLRTIPTKVLSLEDICAPPVLEKLTHLHKGMVLVTGPTGSGKSTTLAAMIDHINHTQAKHILTIEDPIEFVHKSARSLVNQREVGRHTVSFNRALKSALREDPDVVLVGELRDLETIQLALTAAETGHLVMGTLHTSSAAKTIDRIIDVFPPEDKAMVRTMLSSSLEAVISQILIRKEDGSGRVAAREIMLASSAVRNLIREGKIAQLHSIIQVGKKVGMVTMQESINILLQNKIITKEAAKLAMTTGGEAGEESKKAGSYGTGGGF